MRRGFVALLLALVMVAAACGASEQSGTDSAGGETADNGGETVLVIADSATPSTLDPDFASTDQSWAVGQNAYRHFVEFDVKPFDGGATEVDLEKPPIGALAESWEVSDDGMTYTFTLREGVKSPFGNELTTEDVKWSWDRTQAVEGVGSFIFGLGSIDGEKPLTVIDEQTFEIHLTAPSPVFLRLFAIPLFGSPIFDSTEARKHATEEDEWARDWLSTHTAGFGPYHVEEYQAGEEVLWVANPNYWEGELPVQRIRQLEVPDESTRLSLLKEGEVDIATFLGPRARQEARSSDGVKVLSVQGNLGLIVGVNNDVAPFDKQAVRQAVAHAIPTDEIISSVYLDDEFATDFEGYVPNSYPFAHEGPFDYWPYDYNLDKARELMSSAGVDSANVTLSINATRPAHEQTAIQIRDSLAQIGIELEISKLTPAKYQEQYFGRKAQMVLVEDAAWVVDPAYVTVNYFDPGDAGIANWVNYSNQEAAELMQSAYAEGDEDRRFELAGQAYQMVVDDAPWSAYIGTGFHLPARENISGLVWRTDNLIDFKYLKKE